MYIENGEKLPLTGTFLKGNITLTIYLPIYKTTATLTGTVTDFVMVRDGVWKENPGGRSMLWPALLLSVRAGRKRLTGATRLLQPTSPAPLPAHFFFFFFAFFAGCGVG